MKNNLVHITQKIDLLTLFFSNYNSIYKSLFKNNFDRNILVYTNKSKKIATFDKKKHYIYFGYVLDQFLSIK